MTILFRLQITARAEADIQSAADWWRDNRSAEQAERWYDGIFQKMATLSHSPARCPLARESEHVGRAIRMLLYGVGGKLTHRILFTIDDQTVTVLRILHTRQAIIVRDSDLH